MIRPFLVLLFLFTSTSSSIAGERALSEVVAEKAKRNKLGNFIAVASIALPKGRHSDLISTLVNDMEKLVFPDGTTTLGIETLWCCPEDFDAVTKWLKVNAGKYPEVKGLFEGKRYYFDRRDEEWRVEAADLTPNDRNNVANSSADICYREFWPSKHLNRRILSATSRTFCSDESFLE